MRVVLVIQTPAQLREVYGIHNAETMLKSLAARIVFAPKDFPDAREISDELGFTTVPRAHRVEADRRHTGWPWTAIEEPERKPAAPRAPSAAGGEGARHRGGHRVLRGAAARSAAARSATSPTGDFASACCRRRRFPCQRSAAPRSIALPAREPPSADGSSDAPGTPDSATAAAQPRKEDVVIREGTVADIERIESLTLEDFAIDLSKVRIPDKEGPLSDAEMKVAVDTYLSSLERARRAPWQLKTPHKPETERTRVRRMLRPDGRGQSSARRHAQRAPLESRRSMPFKPAASPGDIKALPGEAAPPEAAAPSAAASAATASPLQRADTDPWTVPQSVRDRFVQDGHRFFFPDGAPAFKDLGRRLTTASENTQVVHSLIQIAHSRGWTEVTVTGTERFRQEAWRQARLAGLGVRGYRPSEAEQAQLIRAMGRDLLRSSERVDSISADVGTAAPPPRERACARGRARRGSARAHRREAPGSWPGCLPT